MRFLISISLVVVLLFGLTSCKTASPGFPISKTGPKDSSTTAPSACLTRAKAAADKDDWGTAYRWYARGGGWNAKGRSTGFPSPGYAAEPEETQRFLCIVGFLEATRHLIAQGVRVDADGVHPLYVSLSEASHSIGYFGNSNPHGYAGLTAAQIAALQQGADVKLAAENSRATPRDASMDNLEQVDHSPSHLQRFQSTMAASRDAAASRESANLQQTPPITLPPEKHNDHTEAARLYRESANKYPEGDPKRQVLLELAAEEDRRAAHP